MKSSSEMRSVHDMNHAGVEYVLAKIRSNRWIPGARRFLKLVARQCAICPKRKKAVQSQIMGSITEERLTPSPAFYYSTVDFVHYQRFIQEKDSR